MMWNFGQQNKDKQDEDIESKFQITEEMTPENLPKQIQDKFDTLLNLIARNQGELTANELERDEIKSVSVTLKDEINSIYESLLSFGHQIDNSKKTLKEFQNKLKEAQQHEKDEVKTFPTPFILRYKQQLDETAETISEEITSYANHLQSLNSNTKKNTNSQNTVLIAFLAEEQGAILRESTRIAHLNEKLNHTRSVLCKKLKIHPSEIINQGDQITDSIAQSVKTKFLQFKESQKSKLRKSIIDADIFGTPKTTETSDQPAKSPFAFSTTGSFGNFAKPSAINTSTSGFGKPSTPSAPTSGSTHPFSTQAKK